ncbi:MAG: DEAD/DEAH box helicase, partial [Hyphomicrobiaceae bacterium]
MIKFRPYQQAAIEAGLRCFEKATDSFIIQLPTGGGKTPTGMKIAVEGSKLLRSRGCGGRILWVAHRDYLLKQAASALKLIDNSLQTAWWTADKKEERGDITFCMIGSTRTLEGEYDIVVFDEAHHFAEEDEEYDNMYSKLCKRIKWKYRIGLTATPGRSDTRKLSFEKVAYSIPFFDLVKKHRLAKPIYVEMPTKQRFHLQMRGGDFTRTSLKTLDDPERNAKIVKEWVNGREKYGKTILFAPSVQAAIDIQKEVAHQSPTTESGVIYGEMGDAEKAAVLEWFKAGNSKTPKILLNCMIFTEGYDESSIKTVIVARPTMSKTLWMQMVGRGSRIVTERA